MARPRKEPDELRSDTLAFRLTPSERVRLEHTASSAGVSASEYARSQALNGRVTVRKTTSLDHATFDELRRIGVNLNQLARLANSGHYVPAEVARAAYALECILARELGAEPPEPPQEPPSSTPAPSTPPPRGFGL